MHDNICVYLTDHSKCSLLNDLAYLLSCIASSDDALIQ